MNKSLGLLFAVSVLALSLGRLSAVANPLPTPPQQDAAWTAPQTILPAWLLETTAKLFTEGMADPRGGEYREISVPADSGGTKSGTAGYCRRRRARRSAMRSAGMGWSIR